MSLSVLVAIVVVGVSLTVLAVHLTGGSKGVEIADAGHARQVFAEDFPDEDMDQVTITSDHRTAFLALPGKRTGVVRAIGDKFVTRVVSASDVASVERGPDGAISLMLRDFTWRGGRFAFNDEDAAGRVAGMLDPDGRNHIAEA